MMFSSIPNRLFRSKLTSSVCGSSVLIVKTTPASPAAGAGGWPTFRFL